MTLTGILLALVIAAIAVVVGLVICGALLEFIAIWCKWTDGNEGDE